MPVKVCKEQKGLSGPDATPAGVQDSNLPRLLLHSPMTIRRTTMPEICGLSRAACLLSTPPLKVCKERKLVEGLPQGLRHSRVHKMFTASRPFYDQLPGSVVTII